jgi:hypothetical protein
MLLKRDDNDWGMVVPRSRGRAKGAQGSGRGCNSSLEHIASPDRATTGPATGRGGTAELKMDDG